jgi:ComF family protein
MVGLISNQTLRARGSIWHRIADGLLPPRCFSCGEYVEAQGDLCGGCWSALNFIAAPYCACCGLPFIYSEASDNALCGACLKHQPGYDMARAALHYDEGSKGLILALKYRDKTDGAKSFGRMMLRAAAQMIGETDLILPVPLHRMRLWRRRYNQAGLLAEEIGQRSGKAVDFLTLIRKKATPSQGSLTRRQRFSNMRGAFGVDGPRRARVRDKRVLLVDDVMTTGATVSECARTLKQAGAAFVGIVILARVVGPGDHVI